MDFFFVASSADVNFAFLAVAVRSSMTTLMTNRQAVIGSDGAPEGMRRVQYCTVVRYRTYYGGTVVYVL